MSTKSTVRSAIFWGGCLIPVLFLCSVVRAEQRNKKNGSEFSAARPIDLQSVAHDNAAAAQRPTPLFSWRMSDSRAGARQTAYQIRAASSRQNLAADRPDLWDGKVAESDQSLFVPYGGRPLSSLADGFWKVRIRDAEGRWSPWSAPATWRMGLLQPADWDGAAWIGPETDPRTGALSGPPALREFQPTKTDHATPRATRPAPLLRKEIVISRPVRRATAYVCAMGYGELYVNGRRISDQVLAPAQTSYDRRAFYVPYDITGQLKVGTNAVGLQLGNGFYGQDFAFGQGLVYGDPKVKAVIKVEYADGSKASFGTGADWKVAAGPVLFDNVYVGETYDARREIADWSRPGVDDAAWKPAAVVPGPTEVLVSQNIPPIRKIRAVTPKAVLRGVNGAWILDLGQNLGGWLHIRVREKAGQQIRMRFAELLMPSGDAIDTASTGVFVTGADQEDIYICRGGGEEEWEPRFTYHGFRYVEIDGLSGKPNPKDFTAYLLRTDLPTIGAFHTSDPRLEKFCDVSRWTLEDNLQGVLTDCPHRERCGWLGDLHACGEFAAYSLDMRDFFSRTMDDIRTTRGRGGRNPATHFSPTDPRAPGMISVGKRLCGVATPDWGMAIVLVPWFSYLHYGDLAIVRDNWDMMTDWIAFLEEVGVHDGIVTDGLGDWCPPGSNAKMEAPPTLTSTALFYEALRHMAFFADRLGKADESRQYAARADVVRAAFLRRFIQPDGGFGSQTATAIALWSDLVPADKTEAAVAALESDIMVRHKGHYSTGIFGHRSLYTVLNDNGRGAVSRTLWGRDDWPSLGFLTEKHDLTTWPEVPMDWPAGERYPNNSYNHPMHSGFAATFYESLAGIRPDPARPGYKNTILQPAFLEGINRAGASLASPYGVVQSAWERVGKRIVWKVTIPPNTTAEARLPAAVQGMLSEGSTSVRSLRTERGRRVYTLDSGSHTLRLTL